MDYQRPLVVILLLLLLGLAVSQISDTQIGGAAQDRLSAGEVTIVTAAGERHRFTVEMAVTADQRARGLMFRREMAAGAGMLFDYLAEQPVSFWMKNTFIPLDMLFIRANGIVASIAERTVPQSLTPVPSGVAVRAVLEVNAGTASRLGIEPGDRVLHPIFDNVE
jgi:uncharacterized membrane protein (UPF0127 family)